MEGTDKARKNGEAMGLVGVRLTDQLGDASGEFRKQELLNITNDTADIRFRKL